MRKARSIGVAGLGVTLIALFCGSSCDQNPDARSGATLLHEQKKVDLPPAGDSYDLLGELPGITGFVVQYDDQVFRGGEPHEDSAAKTLQELGIKTIISIVPTDSERMFCHESGFAFVEMPFDKVTGISPENLALLRKTIQTGEAPFFFHCKGGSHRGGTLSAAYRIFIQKWSFEKAMEEFNRLGGDPLTDQGLMESLRRMM